MKTKRFAPASDKEVTIRQNNHKSKQNDVFVRTEGNANDVFAERKPITLVV